MTINLKINLVKVNLTKEQIKEDQMSLKKRMKIKKKNLNQTGI